MNKIEYPGVDHYEAQLIWVRIFETIANVASKRTAVVNTKIIEAETWAIYNKLGKNATAKERKS